ncbi:hypothetical protein DYU11_26145 [Fibrisoma montanum]|uniref:DUF3575 domain-containing protein n=1 Tax=Fibrisoma montanum TaxID=2305895 RepID=A0A418M0B8_9BACT|nr:hypothetical protein [Fibrisoma montanum]RIV18983.1 hypothetical protein DYU11_26145 [Fibrisoma montanum]
MKKTLFIFIWLAALHPSVSRAQRNGSELLPAGRMSWPLMVSVQFHSLALPVGNIRPAFANPGLALGTEYRYNRRGNLLQSIQAGYYRNRYAGDGLFIVTQAGYRPHFGPVYADLKAGVGWNYTFHPNTTLVLKEGQWQPAGRTGKGLLMVPLGLSIGYNGPSLVAPFVGYQFFALAGYNPSVPVVPNQLLQVGAHIHFNY